MITFARTFLSSLFLFLAYILTRQWRIPKKCWKDTGPARRIRGKWRRERRQTWTLRRHFAEKCRPVKSAINRSHVSPRVSFASHRSGRAFRDPWTFLASFPRCPQCRVWVDERVTILYIFNHVMRHVKYFCSFNSLVILMRINRLEFYILPFSWRPYIEQYNSE